MAESASKRPTRAEGARRYGPALEKAYQFVLWLIPAVAKFPRDQRFLLGDRSQAVALNVLYSIGLTVIQPPMKRSSCRGFP